MTFRALMDRDWPQIRQIHKEFYEHEFELPDFKTNYIAAFVVEDDDGKIISVGGVRAIAEVVICTDKSATKRKKHGALYKILDAAKYFAKEAKFDSIHAFVRDDTWRKRLLKDNFRQCEAIPFYTEVN